MKEVLNHVKTGRLLLGICNGAQIGAETGLVPGTFTINAYPKFICKWIHIRVENEGTPFTSLYQRGDVIKILNKEVTTELTKRKPTIGSGRNRG
jgi:phosphoribosylformylglycinamidine synthase